MRPTPEAPRRKRGLSNRTQTTSNTRFGSTPVADTDHLTIDLSKEDG
jgi:hypothetical protein